MTTKNDRTDAAMYGMHGPMVASLVNDMASGFVPTIRFVVGSVSCMPVTKPIKMKKELSCSHLAMADLLHLFNSEDVIFNGWDFYDDSSYAAAFS